MPSSASHSLISARVTTGLDKRSICRGDKNLSRKKNLFWQPLQGVPRSSRTFGSQRAIIKCAGEGHVHVRCVCVCVSLCVCVCVCVCLGSGSVFLPPVWQCRQKDTNCLTIRAGQIMFVLSTVSNGTINTYIYIYT